FGQSDADSGGVQTHDCAPVHLEERRLGRDHLPGRHQQGGAHLYEAAVVDGAGPWRRMWHVTLPGIRGVAVLLLILNLGNILTTGFEQILLQEPAVGARAGQVLDTFVYFEGILAGNWGLSAAVGLCKGVVGTILVVSAN